MHRAMMLRTCAIRRQDTDHLRRAIHNHEGTQYAARFTAARCGPPGALVRAEDYIQAMRARAELCAQVFELMRDIDILVTAGSFEPAPLLKPDEPPTFLGVKVPSLTSPFNLTGQPALSVCNGFDAGGLPLGMQVAGRPFEDATVLALGHAYEKATGFRSTRPRLDGIAAQAARAA